MWEDTDNTADLIREARWLIDHDTEHDPDQII